MSTIKIEGTGVWDGDYEFDFAARRTARELYHFKQIAKVGWDEIEETIREGSGPLVVTAIAVLALVRAGKVAKEQAIHVGDGLLDLAEGEIKLIIDEAAEEPAEEVDTELPPDEAAPAADSNEKDEKPSPETSSAPISAEPLETTLTGS